MKRRLVSSLLSTAACGCLALPALAQQDPPNLIFILTDDMGLEAIEWAGDEDNTHERIFTSNLNAMSAQGVSFTRCRVNPNCSPTRACLMTGRSALDNGVVGVLGRYNPIEDAGNPCASTDLSGTPAWVTNRLALQTQERTIAEVLQDMGYYTILIDKWHLGYNEGYPVSEGRELLPYTQGFDVFVDWMDDICDGYEDPETYFYADHHMLRAMQAARDAVNNRPNPGTTPYALFFHTITPHKRHPDEPGELGWWEIEDQSLLVYTKDALGYQDNAVDRFAQNVEALDTALLDYLLGPGTENLRVLDNSAQYDDEANTIIFFIGDNGTDASLNPKGKNTLFEGGVRVPLFVMGEGITGNIQYENTIDERQISHVDIYDTICDIVGAATERDNPNGAFPRRGKSFAYNIGYSETQETRDITVCSLGNADTGDQVWRVAISYRPPGEADDHWKLMCNSGGAGLDDMTADEFYDLKYDPGETTDLVADGMTYEETEIYYDLRDRLASEWPTAVSVAAEPEDLPDYRPEFQTEFQSVDYVLEVLVLDYLLQGPEDDGFYNVDEDPDRQDNLLEGELSEDEEMLYMAMRGDVEDMWELGERFTADPNVRVVDIPVAGTLVLASPPSMTPPPGLTVGHKDAGGANETEYRVFLHFEVEDGDIPFPTGFSYSNVVSAQLILHFKHDSQEFDPNFPSANTYLSRDTDTEVINVYRMLGPWTVNPWTNYDDNTSLGSFDPPPHIIAIPWTGNTYARKIRLTPMPQGTPVSFGRNDSLKSVIDGWRATPSSNHGVVLIADELPLFLAGTQFRDQQVTFQTSDAAIRLTLNR